MTAGEWVDVVASWDLGKTVALQLDNGKAITRAEPMPGDFGKGGQVTLGNDYAGGQPFKGSIASLEIYRNSIAGSSKVGDAVGGRESPQPTKDLELSGVGSNPIGE